MIELRSASKFLNHNHIQGSCNASIKLGLVYQNEIVAAMCFNKRSKLSGGKMMIHGNWCGFVISSIQ